MAVWGTESGGHRGSLKTSSRNPTVLMRAIPRFNPNEDFNDIFIYLSQSHRTDQGNSEKDLNVGAEDITWTSQSHRTNQGNSEATSSGFGLFSTSDRRNPTVLLRAIPRSSDTDGDRLHRRCVAIPPY